MSRHYSYRVVHGTNDMSGVLAVVENFDTVGDFDYDLVELFGSGRSYLCLFAFLIQQYSLKTSYG